MANIGLPSFNLIFKGLGSSAVARGSKGVAVLIIKDDTDKTFTFKEYTSVSDLTSVEIAKYTTDNIQFITDCLEDTPLKLIVARMDATDGVIADLLALIKGYVPRNCWIGIAGATTTETDALVSFVKSSNTIDKKKFKAFVFKATTSDDMHIVNFTNANVTFADTRGLQTGDKAVPYLLGYLAGLSLSISSIAKVLSKFTSVEEPASLETAINAGEFVLMNDEGDVRVARGITSLITTGEGVTDDMKFILIIEVMDLMYTDIYTTWNSFYKSKYKNNADNQALLIGAINSYFTSLENENLLDNSYDNVASVDIDSQRLANYSKYGQDVVVAWADDYAKEMTYGTNVYLKSSIKILNAMEDIDFVITM